jgi:ferredoxin-nitrate reductase
VGDSGQLEVASCRDERDNGPLEELRMSDPARGQEGSGAPHLPLSEPTRPRQAGATPERWCMSICPYCGVGCGLEVGVAEGEVVAVRGMSDHPVNRGELCVLGKNLVGVLGTEDRLLRPHKRVAGSLEPTSWGDALALTASRIQEITANHGPDAFAMYVSASEHLEEYYVYSKFVKGCLGTNNLESSARLCWASGVVGLVKAFGADSPPCAYDDVELADLFVVSGYNLSSSKPVLFNRLIRARRQNQAQMIVIDPRKTAVAGIADLHLQLRPGTDVALHNAIAHVLIEDGLIDEAQARALTDNYEGFKEHVREASPGRAAEATGLSVEEITRAAHMIAEAKAGLFMWGQGLNQSSVGTRKVTTFLNLVFVTGNLGKPGAGPLAITGQTSAMGVREVGALPHLLPGFRDVSCARARAEVAKVWGVSADAISPTKGKPLPQLLEGIERGEIKALWVIHSNPAATFPDTSWVRAVLEKVEFLVVQDCYHPTETSRYAHVLLPGAQWSEKEGTMTNSERGLNLVERAVEPPGEARADLEIVMEVARAMGFGERFPYASTEEIFEEYKLLTVGRPCDISGVTYARLKKDKGIQWPVPTPDHPGTKRRFVDRDFPQGRVSLGLHTHQEPRETPDEDYPLLLITGLVSGQFHSGTRTRQVPALRRCAPQAFVEVHSQDAQDVGVVDGERVEVVSRRGTLRVRARVTDTIRRGAVFVPYHFGDLAGEEQAVNVLTARSFDEFAQQPEFKACAVRLQKLLPE